MLGKGTAHAAAAVMAHKHIACTQQDSHDNPPGNSLQARSLQAGVLDAKSQPHSQSRHSQHLQGEEDDQPIQGCCAMVMSERDASQEVQPGQQQVGLRQHGQSAIQQAADNDVSVSAKTVETDTSGPSDASLYIDKDVLAMECDADDDALASEQLQMQQSASSNEEEGGEEEVVNKEDSCPDGQLGQAVIGFVVSEAPRGLSGEAGATALCSLDVLRKLYQQQIEAKVLQNGRHGIVVRIKNCGSSQCWKAALHQTDSVPWHRILLHSRQALTDQ